MGGRPRRHGRTRRVNPAAAAGNVGRNEARAMAEEHMRRDFGSPRLNEAVKSEEFAVLVDVSPEAADVLKEMIYAHVEYRLAEYIRRWGRPPTRIAVRMKVDPR